MGLLTLRSASYVGGLTLVVLEMFGNRADVLVTSLTDQPGFSPVRKRSDPTWVPSRESGSCKGTGPFAVASRPQPGDSRARLEASDLRGRDGGLSSFRNHP